jgi:hypothetical protein
MNAARQLELQASLRRELIRQAQEHNLTSTGRVVWLLDQVENYVARWLGLRAVSPQTADAPSDDLFHMIEIGAKAVSAELIGLEPPASAETWPEFLAVLAAARAGSDTIEPDQLAKELVIIRQRITSEPHVHLNAPTTTFPPA